MVKIDDHHIEPRRHSRLWEEEEKREKRKRRCCGGGTHTFWGVLLLLDGSEFGATVANLRAAPGGRIKWGGFYLLNPTFNPRPSPPIYPRGRNFSKIKSHVITGKDNSFPAETQ